MSRTPPTSYSPLPHQSGFTSSSSMAERNDLHDMSPEELELECQHLRDENHQLQLRILGVNELARLLQDRTELVQVLEEKNKRLEIVVVRLENRCANYDRTLKSQKGANVPTAKPGQSPFIPGPSRQILEGLMKENSDLKKTVSNLTGKGAAGYLEAVKATQLEEVIDQQKQEIEFLKDQINQLTSTGIIEEKAETSVGQLSSLPASVSDSGPLKRQLIQMQRAMKVKDRFCTLLSQQVTQLQNRLSSLEYETQDGEVSIDSTTGPPQQESSAHEMPHVVSEKRTKTGNEDQGDSAYKKLYEESKDTLAKEREQKMSLIDKMSSIESQLKEKGQVIDKLEQRCEELTSYHQTLLMEKSELSQMLTETHLKMENLSISGGEGGSPRRGGGATSEPNIDQLQRELKSTADQVNDLSAQLEEANVRTAIANSKLGEIESKHAQQLGEYQSMITSKNQEVREYQDKIHYNDQMMTKLQDRIKDLEEDVRSKEDEYSNLLRDISESRHRPGHTGGISASQLSKMSSVRSGGAPSLFGLESRLGPDDVTTPQQPQKIRNPTVGTPLLSRDPVGQPQPQKQPPTNLGLNNSPQQPGRVSPGPHHAHTLQQQQLLQSKGGQPPLQTPATPVAPNQGNYAAVPSQHPTYTNYPITHGGTISSGTGSYVTTTPASQGMFGPGGVPTSYGQPRMQLGQGGTMHSRPRTMPITSSPTPTNGNRTLMGTRATSGSYTTTHSYVPPASNIPMSTAVQYTNLGGSGVGGGMGGVYPSSSAPSMYGGGRVARGQPQPYTSGPVFGGPGMSGNSHASHLYNTGPSYNASPPLQHQQFFQQGQGYTRADSGSSGYASGDINSGGISSSSMRPTSPRSQNPSGGYPGAQGGYSMGGASGQHDVYGGGMRPTSPRSYDPQNPPGGYPGGQGGAGGQHGFQPPRGQH